MEISAYRAEASMSWLLDRVARGQCIAANHLKVKLT